MTTTLPESVSTARELVEPALREAVFGMAPAMRTVAGYHFGWLDADGTSRADSRRGKALRPALAVLSAQVGGAGPDPAIPAAVAIELVHNFSLLHDDLMDGDARRHHQPTAWTVFGSSAAILGGDAMLALAVQVLAASEATGAQPAQRLLAEATGRLVTGQAADLSFESRSDVGLDECLQMAADKTGALLSCASAIGAVMVGAPPAVVDALARFGERLGLAFQLVDDLLGIWGTTEVTGKPVLADLRARKKSVPVVAALTADHPAADELRGLYLREDALSEDELVRAATLIEDSGARLWTEQESVRRLGEAEASLDAAMPTPAVREQLLDIARFVTGRDR